MELTAEKSKFNETTFVRLSKNNRYICFSNNVWKKLSNQFHRVTEALKNEQNFKFELTKESNLETLPFYGKMYVCFKKNNLYINLDENQWKEFQEKALEIFSPADKENIPPEPTVTKYLYSAEHGSPKSFFSKTSLKQYAEQEGWPYTITEKMAPAPDKQKLVRLVRAYMTQKAASDLVREHCYGCQYDMPGQRDHSCLEEDVEQNYLHLISLISFGRKRRESFQDFRTTRSRICAIGGNYPTSVRDYSQRLQTAVPRDPINFQFLYVLCEMFNKICVLCKY